jgi:muramoyltetrapeptide carboxypeptidase
MRTHDHFQTAWLAPGARVRVIAPSSPFDVRDFELGLARLSARYDVSHDPSITEQRGYLAGDDVRRLRELREAIEDPRLDGIIAARGGYGATRLLAQLDPAQVRARPKLLVGFSDITALHALWARARVGSLHGGMVATLGRSPDKLAQRYLDALEGRGATEISGLQSIARGRAEGVLLGGNLTVLCALLGTPHFPSLHDAVLFLEDIGEKPYRIDRMLTSLRHSGALRGVRAIALGAFEKAEPNADGVRVDDVLAERLRDLGVPVVAGLPCGHVDDNVELPLGTRVVVDADAGRLSLLSAPAT